jgi:hypothetical protein
MVQRILRLGERWIGPFRVQTLLNRCLDKRFTRQIPDSRSAYVVTVGSWRTQPSERSTPLYVGGTTGASQRFRTRLGDLLADMF